MAATETTVRALPSSLTSNRNFILLWTGQFVSQLGDRLAMVAFPWLVYRSSSSAFSTGIVLALYTLPYVLFGPFAGVLIDRFNKRRLMIVADLLRAGLVVTVPFVAERSLTAIFALSFAMAVVAVFFDPAKLALLPDIVPPRQLVRANSLLSMGETLTEVIGYSIAGLVAFYFSTRTAFFADSVTFLVSAVALSLMVYSAPVREAVERGARHFWREMREGLSFLVHNRPLAANTVMVIAAVIGAGAAYPLTFLLAVDLAGGGVRSPRAFGLMEAAIGLGFFLGSALTAGLGQRLRKGLAIAGGLMVMGLAMMSVGYLNVLSAFLLSFVALGAANAVTLIAIDTFVQQVVPEHLRGRVWGVRFAITQGFFALSILVGAALGGFYDVQSLFIVAGIIVVLPGLVGLFARSVREI